MTPVMSRAIRIVAVPSCLGLRPSGVERLPAALLDAGLARRLGARVTAPLTVPEYRPQRDAASGILNPEGLRQLSLALADAVGAACDGGEFPLVLAGDCSVVIGASLALKRRGRHGLLFLDGHADFYPAALSPTGEVADMDLAIVTGNGPAVLADLEGRRPLVAEEDVVAFGPRDGAEAAAHGAPPLAGRPLLALELPVIRRLGLDAALDHAMARLEEPGSAGFWIHLDVDVLDDAVMPAVDYRMPGGLSWAELGRVLRRALAGSRARGMSVAIFNPALDGDGGIAAALVSCLAAGFGVAGL